MNIISWSHEPSSSSKPSRTARKSATAKWPASSAWIAEWMLVHAWATLARWREIIWWVKRVADFISVSRRPEPRLGVTGKSSTSTESTLETGQPSWHQRIADYVWVASWVSCTTSMVGPLARETSSRSSYSSNQ